MMTVALLAGAATASAAPDYAEALSLQAVSQLTQLVMAHNDRGTS